MIQSTVAFSNHDASADAGRHLGVSISEALDGAPPDALIVFASARHDHSALLRALNDECRPKTMVGCSSAGEFSSGYLGEGGVSAVALRSPQMAFSALVGRNLRADRAAAAEQLAAGFRGLADHDYRYHGALVLTDALAGHAEDLVEHLNVRTAGSYKLFGGGAGDDAKFQRTHVFCGTEIYADAAVALEIRSQKPLGVGASHSWKPTGAPLRVTEAHGMKLASLNAIRAVEVFEEYAEATQQVFDRNDPIPFFLHNVLGVESADGYKLRVPLAVNDDGSIDCAADIPTGSIVRIMSAAEAAAEDAALHAVDQALQQLDGARPGVALFFDCVATRLRMGKSFQLELDGLKRSLGGAHYAGCNTYGQIARADGQFNGFHNCTATVFVLPE